MPALFKNILKETFGLLRKYWFYFIKIAAVFFVPLIVLYHCFWENQNLIEKIIDSHSIKVFRVIDNLINLAVLMFFLLFLVALMRAIYTADRGKKLSIISSYQWALRFYGPYLWIKILSLLKMLCWSLLLIVPGIVAGIFYGFSSMALVVDGKRGNGALAFSAKLIKLDVKRYLLSLFCISAAIFLMDVLLILCLDSYIIYFRLKGNLFMSEAINGTEILFAVLSGITWFIFYYVLYREFKKGAEEV